MNKKIARVFPRITKATPTDNLSWRLRHDRNGNPIWETAMPPLLAMPEIDEVHVSVTFTYDKAKAENLAEHWMQVGVPVKIGGPAYGDFTKDFVPGMYLNPDYSITSVGCPNKCWFCSVWKRVDRLYELPIKDGFILQNDNILACSEQHIRDTFAMLKRQKNKAKLTGGLEAKLLKPWHVEMLQDIKPAEMFYAYDTPDDYEPLVAAGKMLDEAGFTLKSRKKFAYVLIGYPKDTFDKAQTRLIDTLKAGFIPFAMLYKDDNGYENPEWRRFQRQWAKPIIIISNFPDYFK